MWYLVIRLSHKTVLETEENADEAWDLGMPMDALFSGKPI